jgi:hypothetical protein
MLLLQNQASGLFEQGINLLTKNLTTKAIVKFYNSLLLYRVLESTYDFEPHHKVQAKLLESTLKNILGVEKNCFMEHSYGDKFQNFYKGVVTLEQLNRINCEISSVM